MAMPSAAWTPALETDTRSAGPPAANADDSPRAAVGERQMFAVHTTKMSNGTFVPA